MTTCKEYWPGKNCGCSVCIDGLAPQGVDYVCSSCEYCSYQGKACRTEADFETCDDFDTTGCKCNKCQDFMAPDNTTGLCREPKPSMSECAVNGLYFGTMPEHCIAVNEACKCIQCEKTYAPSTDGTACEQDPTNVKCSLNGTKWVAWPANCKTVDDETCHCKECTNSSYGFTEDEEDRNCEQCSVCSKAGKSKCVEVDEFCDGFNYERCECPACSEGMRLVDDKCIACAANQYSPDGYECVDVVGCEISTGSSDGLCKKCLAGWEGKGGHCSMCAGTTYSTDGSECVSITNCTSGTQGSSYPQCILCIEGNELISNPQDIGGKVCRPCAGNYYGTNGKTCTKITNCVNGVIGSSSAQCTECKKGMAPNEVGTCSSCTDTQYSPYGTECIQIDHCLIGESVGAQNPGCKKCEKGYIVASNKTCVPCTGNTYNDNSGDEFDKCYEGPAYCVEADHTKAATCSVCKIGYKLEENEDETVSCVECGEHQTSNGKRCMNEAYCSKALRGRAGCEVCKTGYGLNFTTEKCYYCHSICYYDGTRECGYFPEGCSGGDHVKCICNECRPKYHSPEADCQPCPALAYCPGGNETIQYMMNCVESGTMCDEACCTRCYEGYGLVNNLCEKCAGNEYSSDGLECVQIPTVWMVRRGGVSPPAPSVRLGMRW